MTSKNITNLVASGTTVVCDRYYHSGMVYSAAKQNPSLPLSWARAPERGLPRPDAVVFLDLDEATAAARGGWGDEKYEKAEMQRRVRELFGKLAKAADPSYEAKDNEDKDLKADGDDLVVVNAGGSVEEVADRIWERVESKVKQVNDGLFGDELRTIE
jgi:dTMP kinase